MSYTLTARITFTDKASAELAARDLEWLTRNSEAQPWPNVTGSDYAVTDDTWLCKHDGCAAARPSTENPNYCNTHAGGQS